MKMYRTSDLFGTEIKERRILRKTDKFIIFLNKNGKEKKELIESSTHCWHEKEIDAVNYLIDKYQKKVEIAEYYLAGLNTILNNAIALKSEIESI